VDTYLESVEVPADVETGDAISGELSKKYLLQAS
jgi:hypothetical protein